MTKEDIDRLFELLEIYRPKDKHLEDKRLRSAWLLVLEPYKPEDVRQAVADYFRAKKFWPDVTDLAALCPPLPVRVFPRALQPNDCDSETMYRQWKAHCDVVRQAGFPATVKEAIKAGLTLREWEDMLENAGLSCPPEWRKLMEEGKR